MLARDQGKVALRSSNGSYLRAHSGGHHGGSGALTFDRTEVNVDEEFTLESAR